MHTYTHIRRASRCIYISCMQVQEVCRKCVCVSCGFLSTWVFTSPLGVKSVLNYWTGDVEYMKKNSIRRACKVSYFNVIILTSILYHYNLLPCPRTNDVPDSPPPFEVYIIHNILDIIMSGERIYYASSRVISGL